MNTNEIKKLPDELINQIKAGEVVERPYNVVKELVENAIDAGSKQIYIELLDAGKQLIRVTDDGKGIEPTQLKLALERHATSKIQKFNDLESLLSFGFRGEALPSIASVSYFTIKSKIKSNDLGKEIAIECGQHISEKNIHMNTGTIVQVKDLFAGVPVRLKFLKSTATEFAHINDFLIAMSLAWPHISFRFSHNGREVFNYHGKKTLFERFSDVLNLESKDYVEVSFSRGSFKINGFAGLPSAAKSIPSYFITFVNGRYVKDKIVRSGILQAYQGLLLKGLIAPVIIFIEVDPSWLDVNAHPSKTEIRFYDPVVIQDLVSIGVQNAVKRSVHNNASTTSLPPLLHLEKEIKKPLSETIYSKNTNESKQNYLSESSHLPKNTKSSWDGNTQTKKNSDYWKDSVPNKKLDNYWEKKESPVAKLKTDETSYKEKNNIITKNVEIQENIFDNAKYLGQFANCYLILEIKTELWVIDQHAFHERILFEEILNSHKNNKVPRQDLITPIIVPSTSNLTNIVFDQKGKIFSLGFEIEALSNGHIAIHSFPSFLNTQKVPEVFDEIIVRIIALSGIPQTETHPLLEKANKVTKGIKEDLNLPPTSLEGTDIFHILFATMACHNAIRAGDPLNEELVKRLLSRAKEVDFYAHCPHGRPVIRKFSEKDVSSWFQRI